MTTLDTIKEKLNNIPPEAMFAGLVALIVIASIVGASIYNNRPSVKTRILVKQIAKEQRKVSGELSTKDFYDSNLKSLYVKSKTKETFTIISAGADKKFGTEDDISASTVDFNKSRIIGKFIADKTTQLLGGAKDSVKETIVKPKDPTDEGFAKKVGKSIGGTFKKFKNGLKEGASSE